MRQLVSVCSVVLLSASVAGAGEKLTVQWNCAAPAPTHMLPAGDEPGHVFSITQSKCTAAKGAEIDGVAQREGVATEVHETVGPVDHFHGVFVETLANGDKIDYQYKGHATVNAGKVKSATNEWSATNGTGTFQSIEAKGTCTGTPKADGGITFDCSGDYSIPK
jgi:hypothetical protein